MSDSKNADFGVFLWIVLTFTPFAVAAYQYYYFKKQQRYTLQPEYGSKHDPTIPARYIRLASLALQLLLFSLLVAAVALNKWGIFGGDRVFGGLELGLVNHHDHFAHYSDGNIMRCDLLVENFVIDKYNVNGVDLDPLISGTPCFSIVGSSWTVFIFAVSSLVLSLYQLAVLQPFLKWNYFVEPQPGQDLASAMCGGIWVRSCMLLVLHVVMTFMYGIITCSIGQAVAGPSFYMLVGVTCATPLQSFLVARYIQHLPPVRSLIPPEVELIDPTDVTFVLESAENIVTSALELSSTTAATIEKLRACIQVKEQQQREAEAVVAEAQGHLNAAANADNAVNIANAKAKAHANVNIYEICDSLKQHRSDLRALLDACAKLQSAHDAVTAAGNSAKASVDALRPVHGAAGVHINENDGVHPGVIGNAKEGPNSPSRAPALASIAAVAPVDQQPQRASLSVSASAIDFAISSPSQQFDQSQHPHAQYQSMPMMASPTPSPFASSSAPVSLSASASPSFSQSASSSSSPRRRILEAAAAASARAKQQPKVDGYASASPLSQQPMMDSGSNPSVNQSFRDQDLINNIGGSNPSSTAATAADREELEALARIGEARNQDVPRYLPVHMKLAPEAAAALMSLADPVGVSSSARPAPPSLRGRRLQLAGAADATTFDFAVDSHDLAAANIPAPVDSSIVLNLDRGDGDEDTHHEFDDLMTSNFPADLDPFREADEQDLEDDEKHPAIGHLPSPSRK